MIKEEFRVPEDRKWINSKYWPSGVPVQLDYDYSMTLSDLLDRAVKQWGNDPFIWFLDTWVTYNEFNDYVNRLATFLQKKVGIKKGDVVAVHLPNCIQYIVAYYAITKIGGVITGINPTYKPLEVLHQVRITGAKTYIGLDGLYFRDCTKFKDQWDFDTVIWTNLVDLATGMSKLKKFLGLKLKKIPSAPVEHKNAISLLEALQIEPDVTPVEIDTEKDAATLIMTGGTTGVPKAAELTHMNCVSNAIQCELILTNQKETPDEPKLGHKTGMVGVLPLYHSFAMTTVMNCSVAIGSWIVLFPTPPETVDLLKTLTKLPNYNSFCYCGAEILFQRIANVPDDVIQKYPIKGRIKLCISGAGPLHEYVRIPFEQKTGGLITEGYGLTEASPVLTANNFFGEREPGYIGVPAPGTDILIFDAENFENGPVSTLGEEGTGEICACGPQVMKGYWKNPEATANNIKEWNGKRWLLTGDIGFMDEYGRFAIRDRKKQLIKLAGHSVFPKEVETLLGNHEAVEEVAVAGVPDEKLGEAVKAWVVIKPEYKDKLTPEELINWARENMTKWKCPKYIDFIDEVPKNIIGKVLRRVLQENDPLYVAKYGKPKQE